MRRGIVALACFGAACAVAAVAWTAAPQLKTVTCDQAAENEGPTVPGSDAQILFNRVAVPRSAPTAVRAPDRLPYWAKQGLFVRSGRTPVDVIVPRAWRNRVAITWGRTSSVGLHVLGCTQSGDEWVVYAGGFHVGRPSSCVPLIVRVDGHTVWVNVAVGETTCAFA